MYNTHRDEIVRSCRAGRDTMQSYLQRHQKHRQATYVMKGSVQCMRFSAYAGMKGPFTELLSNMKYL